ncbi:MAG: response regulator, partial [Chthoniobacteraceae bacterium]
GEDVRIVAFRITQALAKEGFDVESAFDGQECLRKARDRPPDLLILNVLMPKLSGVDVLKSLRAHQSTTSIGVIACTTRNAESDQADCAGLDVFDYLVKPIEPKVLLGKVQRYFDSHHSMKSEPTLPKNDPIGAPDVFIPEFDEWGNRYALWGSRGSTPTPGARFLRCGGNTSCFAVTYGAEKFIFDAGSGIRDLGTEVMAGRRRKIHLFITHTHWDHIQGFPFFVPAYVPGFEITVWGAELFGKDLKSVFRGQLDRDYFPVQMEDMNSNLEFRHLSTNPIVIGDARVWWEYAQHPGATVGYKIEVGGLKIGWVPDNEFLQGYTGSPVALTRDSPFVTPYRKMIQFLSDVDVLVHEAQYTSEEYPQKIGWGHSCVANACVLMKFAGIKKWIITHHDPSHDDDFLEKKLAVTRRVLESIGHECAVVNGYDGMTSYL